MFRACNVPVTASMVCVMESILFESRLNQMGTEWTQVHIGCLPACAGGLALRLASFDSATVHCCALNLKTRHSSGNS